MPVAGPVWTAEEDEMLRRLVAQYGTKKWAHLATIIKTKKSKQCRRRWKNFQDAELKKTGVWTPAEDALLIQGHNRYGNKWTEIAKVVGGRTDNAVKNRWASLTKKNPRLADGSPGSAPSDSSFSGSMPSQSRSGQSNQGPLQPTRMPGTRPSRLRSLTRPGDAEPNQVSTSNSTVPQHLQHLQGSSETSGSGLTHPRGSLTVRTTVKSELGGSDGSGSARTPGSVNIRVWKESLTPRERQQAQEVNALCLPVTIHLEDQLIPLPPSYGGPVEGGEGAEGSSLWRSDTDGDLTRWLNNGFTPRAAGGPEEEAQEQQFSHFSPMRSQSFINNQQRQLLHKLFMKGTVQQQVMLDGGQQGMSYTQQNGYPSMLQQSQQYEPQHQDQQQQQQQGMFNGQNMLPVFKPGRPDQAAYHINAQAYDSVNYAQQQYGSNQMQSQYQHGVLTRGQSFALASVQPGGYTRGQSFTTGQPGVLARGQNFAIGQSSANPGMDGYAESPRLEVLVTPNFSSQELNMLLEALGDDEMLDMQGDASVKQEQPTGDFMLS